MAAVTVYSAPEDGRKGRPKHVEHTLVVFNKHNTSRVASCWFIIYYRILMHGNSNIKYIISIDTSQKRNLELTFNNTNVGYQQILKNIDHTSNETRCISVT